MGKTFKTAKGTELPLMNLKGKDYLQVAHRLVWCREEHPEWAIETEFVSLTNTGALAKATIREQSGRVLATAHKRETSQGFADFEEKAETGAIGRALALCGYGTQFTEDLDEGDRLADSPVHVQAAPPVRPAPVVAPTSWQAGPNHVTEVNHAIQDRKAFGWSSATVKLWMLEKYKTDRLGQLTEPQYKLLLDAIRKTAYQLPGAAS